GVLPSNTGRGYVLRRLIRRAVLKGVRTLGFEEPFLHFCYDGVVQALGDHYQELNDRKAVVVETLKNEEEQFRRTLEQGMGRLHAFLISEFLNALGKVNSAVDEDWPEERRSELGVSFPFDLSRIETFLDDEPHVVYEGDAQSMKTGLASLRRRLRDVPENAARKNLTAHLKEPRISGKQVFQLYDTFGFPVEVTREIAHENGFGVDFEGYLVEMKSAQERSRSGSGMDTVYGGVEDGEHIAFLEGTPHSNEIFYDYIDSSSMIAGVMPIAGLPTVSAFKILLDKTPFYPESGGQVADIGIVDGGDFKLFIRSARREFGGIWHQVLGAVNPRDEAILDARKLSGYVVPDEEELDFISPDLQTWRTDNLTESLGKLKSLFLGRAVQAVVNAERRTEITRNHTATHLVHAALRNVLGDHVTQAGSLVAPDRLRFDFTHGRAMTEDEIAEVERAVNEEVLKAQPVKTYDDLPLQEARDMGAMALFGEKYADRVRVVQIGDMSATEESFSRELCGGIHVRNTGEIGMFKIRSESSAASGVRRIEAVTGHGAIEWANQQRETVEQAASLLKSQPSELLTSVEKTLHNLREERRRRERLAQQGAGSQEQVEQVGSVQLAVEKLEEADPKDAQLVADRLTDGKPDRVALVVLTSGGKLTFVCKVGDTARAAGAHAGDLIREVAKVAGGGGGGRPDFATAGGRDASKVEEAIAKGREVLAEQVG
ncbi:MAG: hypothetical protein IH945_07170, partial [Armatimonadetes bacterium]|nr:hypothetical protein [Armatimonadota bacterium]